MHHFLTKSCTIDKLLLMKNLLILTFIYSCINVNAQFDSHLISKTFDNATNSVLADIDGDGDLDIVFDQGNIRLFKNINGKGIFGELINITAEGGNFTKAIDEVLIPEQ